MDTLTIPNFAFCQCFAIKSDPDTIVVSFGVGDNHAQAFCIQAQDLKQLALNLFATAAQHLGELDDKGGRSLLN